MFTFSNYQVSVSTPDLTNNSSTPSLNTKSLPRPSPKHIKSKSTNSLLDTSKVKPLKSAPIQSRPSSFIQPYFFTKNRSEFKHSITNNNKKKKRRKPRSRGKIHYPSVGHQSSDNLSSEDSKYYYSDSSSIHHKKKQIFNFVKPLINQRISKTMSGFNLKIGKRRRKSATPSTTTPSTTTPSTTTNGYNLPQSHTTAIDSNVRNNTSIINIDSNFVSGVCPKCSTKLSLLDFIQTKNKASHLTELRDKLMQLESLASHIRQQMYSSKSKSFNIQNIKRSVVSGPLSQTNQQQNSYQLSNLNSEQQQALALLTTHQNITFPVTGIGSFSPQESTSNAHIYERYKEMRKKFPHQEFMIGLNCTEATFNVHSKSKRSGVSNFASKDGVAKQYRQVRSFSSLNGAQFEIARDNMLRIWFKNARGFFLVSFASEQEANTILNLVNIIVNNEDYNQPKDDQIVWGGYIQKKGKRVRLFKQRFLAMQSLDIKIFKSHINFANGEEPSLLFSLLGCDFSQRVDKKELKFRMKDMTDDINNNSSKDDVFLSIKLTSEIERDDFLNLCAQTLGKAIAKSRAKTSAEMPSNTTLKSNPSMIIDNRETDEDTDDDDYDQEMKANQSLVDHRRHSMNRSAADNEIHGHLHTRNSIQRMSLLSKSLIDKNTLTYAMYMKQLENTPRMYGASSLKAMDRLAQKRASDIDFIETTFDGNEIRLQMHNDEYIQTYELLQILGKSMIAGAFLNQKMYFHKSVWTQNKVMLVDYEEKCEIFGIMLAALKKAFDDINIKWLEMNQFKNAAMFHDILVECEESLVEAQLSLNAFSAKSETKAAKKGVAKLWSNVKDKSFMGKVYDNEPYRDAIMNICECVAQLQMYYEYLPQSGMDSKIIEILMKDIKNITKCMMSFGRVVVGDMKEFLFAYLRRGAKNIFK